MVYTAEKPLSIIQPICGKLGVYHYAIILQRQQILSVITIFIEQISIISTLHVLLYWMYIIIIKIIIIIIILSM